MINDGYGERNKPQVEACSPYKDTATKGTFFLPCRYFSQAGLMAPRSNVCPSEFIKIKQQQQRAMFDKNHADKSSGTFWRPLL
eukprot:m.78575 g.78575  ORF g.78575 m.78575 type:complete len:83 (+) comp14120_c1_seq1:456-704(+)